MTAATTTRVASSEAAPVPPAVALEAARAKVTETQKEVASARSAIAAANAKIDEMRRAVATGAAGRSELDGVEWTAREATIHLEAAERRAAEAVADEVSAERARFVELSAFVQGGHLDELTALSNDLAGEIVRLQTEHTAKIIALGAKVSAAASEARALRALVPSFGGRDAFDREIGKLEDRSRQVLPTAARSVKRGVARGLRELGWTDEQILGASGGAYARANGLPLERFVGADISHD